MDSDIVPVHQPNPEILAQGTVPETEVPHPNTIEDLRSYLAKLSPAYFEQYWRIKDFPPASSLACLDLVSLEEHNTEWFDNLHHSLVEAGRLALSTMGFTYPLFIGCTRWMWKRCTYISSDDNATWTTATPDEFAIVPRICRLILTVYETDLTNPTYTPTADNSHGRCTPYIIYRDDVNKEIVLAMRGLNFWVGYHLVHPSLLPSVGVLSLSLNQSTPSVFIFFLSD
ncbi:hypothetical protein LINPERHAP2_LOCUS11691 [Linum perenne]